MAIGREGGSTGECNGRTKLWQAALGLSAWGAVLSGLSCGDSLTPPPPGSIEITTSTDGPVPDADGYTVTIDEGSPIAIGANASLRRDNLEPGTHTVLLAGIAANCTAAGENPRLVEVEPGRTTSISFAVTCNPPVDLSHNRIAFLADGNVASMREDGSNRAMLTRESFDNEFLGIFAPLLWSPDGTRLVALLRPAPLSEQLVTVAADGTGYRSVASGFGNWGIGLGTWSPDGTRITYYKANQAHLADSRIYIVGAEGGAEVQVVTDTAPFITRGYHDLSPAWSPDGGQIAFLSDRATPTSPLFTWHLFIANVAGSLARQLSPISVASFQWAPDGRRIAFVEGLEPSAYGSILVLDLDAGSSTRLSPLDDMDADPVWSPDGGRLAFISIRDGNEELYVMDADGSDVRRLTSNAADDTSPAWSPDGTHLVFQTNRDGNWEIYTIDAGGSGLTNLTRSPGQETAPAWR